MNCLTIHRDMVTLLRFLVMALREFVANSKGDQGSTGIEKDQIWSLGVSR